MGDIIKLPTLKTDNKSVGERSEAMILARLSEFGYLVYLPFGENYRSDMIAEDEDGNLLRIQCKTGVSGIVVLSLMRVVITAIITTEEDEIIEGK